MHRLTVALALMGLLCGVHVHGQAIGDYGSIASGAWSGGTTWGIWNGSIWAPTATPPTTSNNVFIRSGTTVAINGPGPYYCTNLTVEAPAATTRLWANNPTTPVFLYVYGSQIVCNGSIGNGATFDGISFAIEGATVTASGAGIWDCARIRKRTAAPNATSNFIINTNINLRFVAASSTQIYNETANSNFHVTVNAGYTLTLVGSGGLGNACMNGTAGTGGGGGSYTINGSMIIPGTLILTTQSANPAYACAFTINAGGYVRANQLNCSASMAATQTLTINNGGTLEIDGTPTTFTGFSLTGNTYNIGLTSLVNYSGNGNQTVQHQFPSGYGHLLISGSVGNKTLGGNTLVRSNLTISNASGSPRLDASASNYNLSVGGNWSNYGPLGFTEQLGRVIFTNHYAATTLTTPGGEVFYNLQMSKNVGHVMTMNNNVTVTNNLVFQLGTGGCLDLNANMLTITNPLTTAVSGGNQNGFIRSERMDNQSRMRWSIGATTGAHVFPFGTGSSVPSFAANYIPFTYNLTAGNAGDVTLATYSTPPNNLAWPVSPITVLNLNSTTGLLPDNRDATVDRFWEIDHAGTPTTSYTFVYRISELPVAPFNIPAAIQAQRYDDPIDKWQVPLAGQSSGPLASAYFANVNNVTQASAPWTLSALASPLPIELIDFHTEGGCGQVEVKWSTATEKDNDHFMLRRSADGEVFEDLVRVEGAGTSQQRLDYSYVDVVPLQGMNYYRLDQVDVDGTETQSAVIAGRAAACGEIGATVFPNPATDQLSIVGLPQDSRNGVTIELLDAQGRLLRSWLVADDRSRFDIDKLGVAPGGYLLRIVTNDRSQTARLVVR